jgi:hypothetical protein
VDFALSYSGFNRGLLGVLGAGPRHSGVELDTRTLRVRLGPWFRASVDRDAIAGVRPDSAPVRGWGAHGWRGTWLVNGSSHGIVRIDLDPAQRAWVVGVPVSLRALRVSVEDPDALIAALRR